MRNWVIWIVLALSFQGARGQNPRIEAVSEGAVFTQDPIWGSRGYRYRSRLTADQLTMSKKAFDAFITGNASLMVREKVIRRAQLCSYKSLRLEKDVVIIEEAQVIGEENAGAAGW